MVLKFPILADYAAFWLGDLMVWATHGHVYNMNNLPPFKKGDVLLHGHTHIPVRNTVQYSFRIRVRRLLHVKHGSQTGLVFTPGCHVQPPYLVTHFKSVEDGSVISSFTVE